MWNFTNHVHHMQRIPSTKQFAEEKPLIVFRNGFEVEMDVLYHSLETRLERARMCRYVFTDGIEQKHV